MDGRDIGRYLTGKARNYFEFDVRKIHSCKREDIFLVPEKILFRRVGERIIATLDAEQNYALNTLVVMTPKPECKWPLRALLGILNSSVANFYYTYFLKSSKEVFSEIQARQIAQVPLPKIDWEDSSKLKKLNELAKLVDEILETVTLRASGDSRQRELRKQSELLDQSIDRIVFDLYGLTQSEREVVVTALKARQDPRKNEANPETPSLFE